MNQQRPYDEWEEKIVARVTGGLSAEECTLFDQHVKSCAHCIQELREYELLSRRLHSLEKDIIVPTLSPVLLALKQEIVQHHIQEQAQQVIEQALAQEEAKQAKEGEEVPKIKALFLAANPRSTNRLAIDEEMHAIEQNLRAAEHRDALVFQSAWAAQPDDLLQLLNQHQPHIVHFSGHGSGEGLSLMEDDGRDRLVTPRAFKALFTTLRNNIRLVVLNACYSREQAQTLVESIDCVMGMKESIHNDAAIAFASSFYRAIGFGRSIQEAFKQGITSLLLEGLAEEDIPELLVKTGVDANQIILVSGRKSRVASPAEVVLAPAQTIPTTDQLKGNGGLESQKQPVEVFISYSHKDKLLCDQLAIQLSNLRRQGVIRDWFDGDIIPGTEWSKQIQQHLESAQIILLLISADFMASEFCYSIEMAQAIQRHEHGDARVLPILLRPTDYEGAPFAKLPMLPTDAKPITRWTNQDDAFEDIVKDIRRAINELSPPPIPYAITSPKDGSSVSIRVTANGTDPITVHGTTPQTPSGKELWLLVEEEGIEGYYPQNGPINVASNGTWSANAVLGGPSDAGKKFVLYTVLVDQNSTGKAAIDRYFREGRAHHGYTPIYPLPDGIQLVTQVTVKRG